MRCREENSTVQKQAVEQGSRPLLTVSALQIAIIRRQVVSESPGNTDVVHLEVHAEPSLNSSLKYVLPCAEAASIPSTATE